MIIFQLFLLTFLSTSHKLTIYKAFDGLFFKAGTTVSLTAVRGGYA